MFFPAAKELIVEILKKFSFFFQFPWKNHLSVLFSREGVGNLTNDELINIPSPDFLKGMGEIFQNANTRFVD
mgnify:CR=1 FL=1